MGAKPEDAFYYYKIRSTLEGFQEEKFHAFHRCGELSERLNHDWYDSFAWYMKAFEHSQRVEPLVKISEHYMKEKKWLLAYTFIDLACKLEEYPHNLILFVDKRAYEYTRWHLMAIIASHVGANAQGKAACLKALKIHDTEEDQNILKYYENIDKESSHKESVVVTKNQFMAAVVEKLKKDFPKLKPKQIHSKANKMWKDRRNKNKK